MTIMVGISDMGLSSQCQTISSASTRHGNTTEKLDGKYLIDIVFAIINNVCYICIIKLQKDKYMRSLSVIASEIKADWGLKTSPHAKPYLNAMAQLTTTNDTYGFGDSGKSIVLYFLCNAGAWKGDTAKRIKAELKAMCK